MPRDSEQSESAGLPKDRSGDCARPIAKERLAQVHHPRWGLAALCAAMALAPASAHAATAQSPCSTSSSPYRTAVSGTPGLAAYWRLGETSGRLACDERATSPGTYTGGYELGQASGTADGNKAVALNGSSGYVDVPSTKALNPTSAISIEAAAAPTTTDDVAGARAQERPVHAAPAAPVDRLPHLERGQDRRARLPGRGDHRRLPADRRDLRRNDDAHLPQRHADRVAGGQGIDRH